MSLLKLEDNEELKDAEKLAAQIRNESQGKWALFGVFFFLGTLAGFQFTGTVSGAIGTSIGLMIIPAIVAAIYRQFKQVWVTVFALTWLIVAFLNLMAHLPNLLNLK